MRGKKTDIETKAKIIESKINNPDISAQVLANKLGLSERTTSRVIKEEVATIGEKSKKVQDLIDSNNTLISLADERLKELLENKEKDLTARDLVSVRDSGFKQNQLLTGGNTENVNLKNNYSELSTDELLKLKLGQNQN